MNYKPICVSPGVKLTTCEWGMYYEGKPGAMVAAGIAQEDWFSDGTKLDKHGRTVRTLKLMANGRAIESTINGRTGRAILRVCKTDSERATEKKRKELQEAQSKAEIELAWIPDTPERFRELIGRAIDVSCSAAWGSARRGLAGYRFEKAAVEEFKMELQQATASLLQSRILLDRNAHAAAIEKVKLKVAKADPDLQEFMANLSAVGP